MPDVITRNRTVRANGIDIAYTDIGSGPPLVLLHGAFISTGLAWAGSPAAHVDHLPVLADHFRVIAPDTRGSGASVHPGGPITFDVLANDVIALIDALDLERPVIAGFSEGGATATLAALSKPERFRALINHAGYDYFYPNPAEIAAFRTYYGGSADATAPDPAILDKIYAPGADVADHMLRMRLDFEEAQGTGHWRTYISQLWERTVADFGFDAEDLGRVAIPTLVLAGDRDFFCSAEMSVATHRAIPDSELGLIPGLGHAINAPLIAMMIEFAGRFDAD